MTKQDQYMLNIDIFTDLMKAYGSVKDFEISNALAVAMHYRERHNWKKTLYWVDVALEHKDRLKPLELMYLKTIKQNLSFILQSK